MTEIETILWDFLRGVRQGSFRDDPDLVKGYKNKLEALGMPQSRASEGQESIERRINTSKEALAKMEELTSPEGSDTVKTAPPPITPTHQIEETKSKPSIADFGVPRKQKQNKSDPSFPQPPTRGEFFVWFPWEEFGDLSVTDGILKFFLSAASPTGNPMGCNLTPKQVAQWYVHKLSLDAFSRYTPRGHTQGVKAFWANLGKWSKSGIEELEEAATWCRRVGTANAVKHRQQDSELQEKLQKERERTLKGPDIPWEEF